MEITLICAGIALVATIVSSIILGVKLHRYRKDFLKMTEIHDNFVNVVIDTYDDLVEQANEAIDQANGYLNDIDEILGTNEEILRDVIDTIGLGLDTDELLLKKIQRVEDESDYMWAVMEEHDDMLEQHDALLDGYDDILYEIFEEEPEEAEDEELICEDNKKKKSTKTNK